MKNPNLALRKAYVAALIAVPYAGKNIPVYEDFLQPTASRPIAKLAIGEATVEAYIILLNQTSNDNSPKCVRNDEASIQVQITTVWPLFKGGKKTSEEISDVILSILFTEDGLFNKMPIEAPFDIWKGSVSGIRPLSYTTDTNTVWITQLILTNSISQS